MEFSYSLHVLKLEDYVEDENGVLKLKPDIAAQLDAEAAANRYGFFVDEEDGISYRKLLYYENRDLMAYDQGSDWFWDQMMGSSPFNPYMSNPFYPLIPESYNPVFRYPGMPTPSNPFPALFNTKTGKFFNP